MKVYYATIWVFVVSGLLSCLIGAGIGFNLEKALRGPPPSLSSATYCQQYSGPEDHVGFPRKCELEAVVVTEGRRRHVEIYIDRDKIDGGALDAINAYWLSEVEVMP